jgi:hypothetical protein
MKINTIAIVSIMYSMHAQSAEPITIKNLDKVTCLLKSIKNHTNSSFLIEVDRGKKSAQCTLPLEPSSGIRALCLTPQTPGAVKNAYLHIINPETNTFYATLGIKLVSRLQFLQLQIHKQLKNTRDVIELSWTVHNDDQTVKDTYYWHQELELHKERACSLLISIDIPATSMEDAMVDLATVINS